MDYVFLTFAAVLGIAGLVFTGFFVYKLLRAPEAGPKMQLFNRLFLSLAAVVIVVGLGLAWLGEEKLAAWGQVQAAGVFTLALWFLAAEGFGIGFKQMEEDGVGFLRFFQLGSSVLLCYSLAPAIFAFITFFTNFR